VRIKLAGSCRALLTCDWTRIAAEDKRPQEKTGAGYYL